MIASEGSLWEALATLYVAWGSTYLAIRVLVESVLPVLASGVRFVAAGALLALVIAARGGLARFRVGRREALSAARASALTIAAAFSLLFLGETEVPAVCEAVGSFIAQRVRLPGDLLVSAALQMLFGGAVTVLVAVAIGELGDVGAVPLDGVLAFLYLVLPGSVCSPTRPTCGCFGTSRSRSRRRTPTSTRSWPCSSAGRCSRRRSPRRSWSARSRSSRRSRWWCTRRAASCGRQTRRDLWRRP